MITDFMTPDELAQELGERLRGLRIRRGLGQREAAAKAGVSERSLRSLEGGGGSTLETFLRVMKALDALSGLDSLVPPPTVDPLALLGRASSPRRVRRARTARP
jgi:transcriptional regulator with XRE-family HTH domain